MVRFRLSFLLAVTLFFGAGVSAHAGASRMEQRASIMQKLFAELRASPDSASAAQTRALIANIWTRHDSPTANLLMARVEASMMAGRGDAATALLDRIVELYPDWPQAWRRRAEAAFSRGDLESAEIDLRRALAAEPRDFLAMHQLAELLRQDKKGAEALELLRRELTLDPQDADLRKEMERLTDQVEGQGI
jgi:tetratricopeptide (TPR) repeat protein